MTRANRAISIDKVIHLEGRYSNDPHDPGGCTNMGIEQRDLDAWCDRKGQPRRDVRTLTRSEACAIYEAEYWNNACDDLPSGVDFFYFDDLVNTGTHQATKNFQRVLEDVKVDGIFGPLTLRSFRAKCATLTQVLAFIAAYAQQRESFYERLRTYRWFGRGWTARVHQAQTFAVNLAGNSALTAQSPATPQQKPALDGEALMNLITLILKILPLLPTILADVESILTAIGSDPQAKQTLQQAMSALQQVNGTISAAHAATPAQQGAPAA